MRERSDRWERANGSGRCMKVHQGVGPLGMLESAQWRTPPVDGGDLGRLGAIRGGVAGTARPWGIAAAGTMECWSARGRA